MTSVIVQEGLLERLQGGAGTMSDKAMARAINVSIQTLQELKNGRAPSVENLASICEAFGLSFGDVATLKEVFS